MLDTVAVQIVDTITFGGVGLDVYSSVDVPLFRVTDIAALIGYSEGNGWNLLELCEEDEKLNLPLLVAGQKRKVTFVTELGLYNILAQSRKPMARKWRRIVHQDLIRMRKEQGRTIVEQFDEWNHELDALYIDEITGIMMQSVTVEGGDVDQIPYIEEE